MQLLLRWALKKRRFCEERREPPANGGVSAYSRMGTTELLSHHSSFRYWGKDLIEDLGNQGQPVDAKAG